MSKPNAAQELLAKIKDLFSNQEKLKFETYKLKDGTTSITCDKMEVGGKCMMGDQTLGAGDYTLEDGTVITVDANGMITNVTAPAPETDTPDMTTPEGMRKAYERFANGTPEERIANLEILCKAMMEYCFGWQLREAQAKQSTDNAIKVYKEMTDTTAATVVNQQKMMKQMFEALEMVAAMKSEPIENAPENTKKKFSFSNVEGKKKSIDRFKAAAEALKKELEGAPVKAEETVVE